MISIVADTFRQLKVSIGRFFYRKGISLGSASSAPSSSSEILLTLESYSFSSGASSIFTAGYWFYKPYLQRLPQQGLHLKIIDFLIVQLS